MVVAPDCIGVEQINNSLLRAAGKKASIAPSEIQWTCRPEVEIQFVQVFPVKRKIVAVKLEIGD